MPQPFSTIKPPRPNVLFTPNAPAANPALAVKIVTVLNHWASLDVQMGSVFARLLRSDPVLAVAMYTKLLHSGSPDAVLDAAATTILQDEQELLDLYWALKKITRAPRDQRNAIAHGGWGYASGMDDALLLQSPKATLKSLGAIQELTTRGPGSDPAEWHKEFEAAFFEDAEIWIYREHDFDLVIRQISTAAKAWMSFGFVLNEHPARRFALDSLYKTPDVLAAVNKVRAERGEPPLAAPT